MLAISVNAAGGQAGVAVTLHHHDGASTITWRDDSGERLPAIADAYAREDDFVACLAQGENDAFGLTLQTRLVRADERATIVECVVEMQTRLLDSHPAVRLSVADTVLQWRREEGLLVRCGENFLGLLLTPRDRAACQDLSGEVGPLQLRVFGEFLEKGVIQKCRMWWVAWGEQQPTDAEWSQTVDSLAQAPLPLTT
ncbi:hypothetical protein [Roseimaritima ulvae]|nr:hypothetical protein [Roseimaritima ulvae]